MKTLSYPYNPKPHLMFLAVVLSGAFAFFMSWMAMGNDRGLVLNGLIHLGPSGATIFYWCIAAVGAAFVAIALPAMFVGLFTSHQVTLTSTDVSARKSAFSRKPTVVKLSDIRDLSLQAVQGDRFLNIYHTNGRLTIIKSHLPDERAFNELCNAIADRIPTQPRAGNRFKSMPR